MRGINALTGILSLAMLAWYTFNPSPVFAGGDDKPVIGAPTADQEVGIDLHSQIEALEAVVYGQGAQLKAQAVEIEELKDRTQKAGGDTSDCDAVLRRVRQLEDALASANVQIAVLEAMSHSHEEEDLDDELSTLQETVGSIGASIAALDGRISDIANKVELLEKRVGGLEKSYYGQHISYSVGSVSSLSLRPKHDADGPRQLPRRSLGLSPSAMVCAESSYGWGVCGYGLAGLYADKGTLLEGGVMGYRVVNDRFAMGLRVSGVSERYGVYDTDPYLYGASAGPGASAFMRITSRIDYDRNVAWDMLLTGGVGIQHDLLKGHDGQWMMPGWFSVSFYRRKVVSGTMGDIPAYSLDDPEE